MATKKRVHTPEEKMALAEHLNELRKRIIIVVVIVLASMIFGFVWYDVRLFGVIPSLGEILRGPYCSIPPEARLHLGPDGSECRLLATGPFEQFMLRLKVGTAAGCVVTSPLWLYQLWAFVAPGLYKKEKRLTLIYISAASLLFISGAVLAYYVVAKALDFLLQMGNNVQITALSGSQYFSFIVALILIFGMSFELPLLIVVLNVLGVVHYTQLKKWRRVLIFLLFVFAAFVTPGGDPVSMSSLAITLTILQEIAIQICRVHDKRKAKKRPDWLDDSEEASEIESPTPVPPSAIGAESYTSELDHSSALPELTSEPDDSEPPTHQASARWNWVDDIADSTSTHSRDDYSAHDH